MFRHAISIGVVDMLDAGRLTVLGRFHCVGRHSGRWRNGPVDRNSQLLPGSDETGIKQTVGGHNVGHGHAVSQGNTKEVFAGLDRVANVAGTLERRFGD